MKKHVKFDFKLLAIITFFAFSACETTDLDLTSNPSAQSPEDASIEFLFNSVQLGLNSFYNSIQFSGAQVTRMELMRTSSFYETQFQPTNFNASWTIAYAGVLNDSKLVKELLSDLEDDGINVNYIKAANQIIEAYVITTLVDYFNDIPYSEALQGSDNLNPGRDDGREVYQQALGLLTSAVSMIDQGGSVPIPVDLYYNGNMANWKRAANSLIIKLSVNSRLNDSDAAQRINSVIATGDFINNNSQDFQFNYSTVGDNPDSRHPIFAAQYDGVAGIYMALPYINRMVGDPRFNYYFYLQNGQIFARPHGDTGPGVASEFNNITVHGLYPYGGKYNDGTTGATNRNMGALGAGANVFMSNFATQFLIAEAQLMLNNNVGGARIALENAISASINKVTNFRSSAIPSGAPVPTQAEINAYIASALASFDSVSENEAKLDVIITEYYKSLWGNGIDSYNNFRRTGYPSDMEPSIVGNPGTFTNTMYYPAIYISNNNNPDAVPRVFGEKVWWAEGTNFNLDF